MDNEGIDDAIILQLALTIITGCHYRVLEMLVTDNFYVCTEVGTISPGQR